MTERKVFYARLEIKLLKALLEMSSLVLFFLLVLRKIEKWMYSHFNWVMNTTTPTDDVKELKDTTKKTDKKMAPILSLESLLHLKNNKIQWNKIKILGLKLDYDIYGKVSNDCTVADFDNYFSSACFFYFIFHFHFNFLQFLSSPLSSPTISFTTFCKQYSFSSVYHLMLTLFILSFCFPFFILRETGGRNITTKVHEKRKAAGPKPSKNPQSMQGSRRYT